MIEKIKAISVVLLLLTFISGCNQSMPDEVIIDDTIIEEQVESDDSYPTTTETFYKAKQKATEIHLEHQIAFYSGCEYYAVEKKLIPIKETCGYVTRKNETRASRIEWEHVVSMWQVGHQLQCWQDGGRANCNSNNKYRHMETDLHNLVPTIGEINGDRSNYEHGMIEGEPRVYGENVDAEVDFSAKVFEPRPEVRGDIARIYFYMQQKYALNYSDQKMQLYTAWSNSDPVDSWEITRNHSIAALQGDSNHFVSNDNDYSPSLSCDPEKKYCSHMTSCEDATYYLQQCGRTGLDGNKDGTPCESSLCY